MISATEAAYRAGRIACADGKSKDQNPYPFEAQEYGLWNRGWNEEFAALPAALQAARRQRQAQV